MDISVAGPSGGSGGEVFSDVSSVAPGVSLAAVELRAGDVVDAIRSVYRHGTEEVPAPWHGGSGGELHRLELRAGEFITEIAGTYGEAPGHGHVVRSLSLQTNLRPRRFRVGAGGGVPFRYEVGVDLDLVGFAGASGAVLDAVGPLLRKRARRRGEALLLGGPTGGEGGRAFSDAAFLGRSHGMTVSRVTVRADRFLDAIAVDYVDADGALVGRRRHGGDGGEEHQLTLRRGEYITAVSGRFGTLVDRIVIDTNRRKAVLAAGANFRPLEPRTPFGADYRYEAPPGYEIAGFLGRSATFVDALGAILRPRPA
ncbi:MAG: hypothetical protein K1X87_11155 [Dehalococcoidia bacterium]|nr:hypothetical protein [Dehalococcoidia bacterium]